jgi:hypothetical protein
MQATGPRPSKFSVVLCVTRGNFLEMFDFFLHGHFSRSAASSLR